MIKKLSSARFFWGILLGFSYELIGRSFLGSNSFKKRAKKFETFFLLINHLINMKTKLRVCLTKLKVF